jgi:hypothetical protein
MADKKNTKEQETTPAPAEETLLNLVAAPEGALIGDENIPPAGDVDVQTVNRDVPAQVTGKPAVTVETVKESGTFVRLDEVITDPNDPRGVQIPDAGRGSLDLPFHRLTSPRPEDVFSGKADPDYDHSESVLDGDGEAVSTDGRVQPTP